MNTDLPNKRHKAFRPTVITSMSRRIHNLITAMPFVVIKKDSFSSLIESDFLFVIHLSFVASSNQCELKEIFTIIEVGQQSRINRANKLVCM